MNILYQKYWLFLINLASKIVAKDEEYLSGVHILSVQFFSGIIYEQ